MKISISGLGSAIRTLLIGSMLAMLTTPRKRILLICSLIALAEIVLLIRFWPDLPTPSALKPTPVLADPQPTDLSPRLAGNTSLCGENALFDTISEIHTLGAMIERLGPPEKVYRWHRGGPENFFVRYGYIYIYPSKGFNFIANGPARIYGNAEVIDPKFVPPTVMPMDNLQATVTPTCYAPTTFEAYRTQYPGYGEGDSHFGDEYVDWISP